MTKKEIIQSKCSKCAFSQPFSERVITCKLKNMRFVANATRICNQFKTLKKMNHEKNNVQ